MSAIIKALSKALEMDPSDWENRHALIEAYLKDGRRDEAHQLLSEIEALPEDEGSLIAAAQCYAIAGSPQDARGILQPVLQANPGNAEAHLALASIAHLEGDSSTAMRHYITATSLNATLSSPELEEAYGSMVNPAGAPPAATPAPAAEPVSEEVAPESVAEPEPEPEAVVETEPEIEAELEQPQVSEEVEEAEAESAPAEESIDEPEPVESVEIEPSEPEPVSQVRESTEPLVEAEENPEQEEAEEPEAAIEPEEPAAAESPDSETEPAAPAAPVLVARKPAAKPDHKTESADIESKTGPLPDAGEADLPDDFDGEEEDWEEGDHLLEELRERHDEVEASLKRSMQRDKLASLTVTILIHVAVFAILGLVVISVPRDVPPQLVAAMAADTPDKQIDSEKLERVQRRPTTTANSMTEVVTAVNSSPVAMSSVDFDGLSNNPSFGVEFTPSMSFGSAAPSSLESKMMFGQEIEGEVLGVILDVSGSMAEYLPMVIREVDKSFKNAPIVYVNHAGMLGAPKAEAVYPVIKEEVLPSWPRDWAKGSSPFWFLWGDLPRKAPQKTVDRLIGIFKSRPNMFIVRGGNNRVGSAAEFLIEQKCDSLYIFSDFEDFVDEEYCVSLGQKLGLSKVRAYAQPAAALTEHFSVVRKKVANRSKGRALPPLTEILRPSSDDPPPIMVEVEKETPVPDGVKFATTRTERRGEGVFNYNWGTYWNEKYAPDTLEIIEYPNFDIEIRGPEARAYIYMKTSEGYIGNPIIFGYHSRKPYLDERDERWHSRKRKFLRSIEPPTLDDDTFTWRMMLEDEIEFKVLFWFKEDSMTATYMAEKPPNGESDGAFIYFVVPPVARENQDNYFSVDFPDGLNLDDLRLAMTNNTANFYLPAQAEDRLGTSWSRLGFKRGANICPYNIIYRDLPTGVREVTIQGPSFGPRILEARTTSNNLLLSTGNRADLELWEGFSCRLARPGDIRERISKLEAIKFTVE